MCSYDTYNLKKVMLSRAFYTRECILFGDPKKKSHLIAAYLRMKSNCPAIMFPLLLTPPIVVGYW
jgi:hypothetical protein